MKNFKKKAAFNEGSKVIVGILVLLLIAAVVVWIFWRQSNAGNKGFKDLQPCVAGSQCDCYDVLSGVRFPPPLEGETCPEPTADQTYNYQAGTGAGGSGSNAELLAVTASNSNYNVVSDYIFIQDFEETYARPKLENEQYISAMSKFTYRQTSLVKPVGTYDVLATYLYDASDKKIPDRFVVYVISKDKRICAKAFYKDGSVTGKDGNLCSGNGFNNNLFVGANSWVEDDIYQTKTKVTLKEKII